MFQSNALRRVLLLMTAGVWLGGLAWTGRRIITLKRLQQSDQDLSAENKRLSRQILSMEELREKRMNRSTGLKKEQLQRIRSNARLNQQNIEAESQTVQMERKVFPLLGENIYAVVDTQHNRLYLRKEQRLLLAARCSVGKGGLLTDPATGRKWEFITPRGILSVQSRETNPVWWKPDWAFIEENKPVPPPGAPERKAEGELGKFALNLGYGYKIHGTRFEYLLGRSVTHGCVRVGGLDLEQVFKRMRIGARVYVY